MITYFICGVDYTIRNDIYRITFSAAGNSHVEYGMVDMFTRNPIKIMKCGHICRLNTISVDYCCNCAPWARDIKCFSCKLHV